MEQPAFKMQSIVSHCLEVIDWYNAWKVLFPTKDMHNNYNHLLSTN